LIERASRELSEEVRKLWNRANSLDEGDAGKIRDWLEQLRPAIERCDRDLDAEVGNCVTSRVGDLVSLVDLHGRTFDRIREYFRMDNRIRQQCQDLFVTLSSGLTELIPWANPVAVLSNPIEAALESLTRYCAAVADGLPPDSAAPSNVFSAISNVEDAIQRSPGRAREVGGAWHSVVGNVNDKTLGMAQRMWGDVRALALALRVPGDQGEWRDQLEGLDHPYPPADPEKLLEDVRVGPELSVFEDLLPHVQDMLSCAKSLDPANVLSQKVRSQVAKNAAQRRENGEIRVRLQAARATLNGKMERAFERIVTQHELDVQKLVDAYEVELHRN
jgi:hypothetical protein